MCVSTDIQKFNLRTEGGNSDPRKYNGGQLYINPKFGGKSTKNMCINVDWLTLSLDGKIEVIRGNSEYVIDDVIALVREERRLSNHDYFYKVYVHGEEFGELCTQVSEGSVMARANPNLSSFRFSNHILYQENVVVRAEYLFEKLGVRVHGVSRMDIAVDGGNFLADFRECVEGNWERVGRAKHSIFGGSRKQFAEGYYIGSGKSEKRLMGYNKSKEMQDKHKSGKPLKTYILEAWKNAGIDMTKDVERLELKLKSQAFKQVKNFDWTMMENSQYLAGIMKSFLNRFYEFVECSKDTNVTRKNRIQAVDWAYFGAVDVERVRKKNKPNPVWSVKQAIRFLMMVQFSDVTRKKQGDIFGEIERCRDFAEMFGVVEWFDRKVPEWERQHEYHDEVRRIVMSTRNSHRKRGSSAMFTNA